jgi:peroxiredoxin
MKREALIMKSVKKISLIIAFIFLTAMGAYSPADSDKSPPAIEKAADFSLKDPRGAVVSLSSMRGKVVLLNFWATWCPPCISEMPSLNKLYQELRPRGFEVVAVSLDKSAENVREFISKKGFKFLVLIDESNTVSKRYKVFSTPTTFLIDRKGNIVERFYGEYDWQDRDIRAKIEKLF